MATRPPEHASPATRSTTPLTLGPYSPSVSASGLVFLSGQTGKQPGTRVVDGSIEQQTVACLRNLANVLVGQGLDYSALVKCNVYLVDIDDFDEMNEAFRTELSSHRPARTTVAVIGLPLGARVEIEAIAQLRSDS
jgi:2-iminobutanoate/2-iminopropanoate deaminase